jgi:DNA-binding NarL/FixJ family response regulator
MISILLADDHHLVREGIRLVLERERDLRVIAEAADGMEAIAQADLHQPNLAILDVTMPRLSGLKAARELARRAYKPVVVMLSMHDDEQFFFEAINAGANGYVLKSAADTDLVSACRAAVRGDTYMYPAASRALIRDYLELPPAERKRQGQLSARELEIVQLIAGGNTARQIAERLVISEKTVDRHRTNILEKLHLKDRLDLARYAIRRGLIDA